MKKDKLKIFVASSEMTPLAKTGGLADVVTALSEYLDAKGHDIRVLIPQYSRFVTELEQYKYRLRAHQLRGIATSWAKAEYAKYG